MSKRAFRIWVDGRLNDSFVKGIDPALEQETVETNTALSGELSDQAQLYGLLQRLSALGVDVIRFETYPPTDEPECEADGSTESLSSAIDRR